MKIAQAILFVLMVFVWSNLSDPFFAPEQVPYKYTRYGFKVIPKEEIKCLALNIYYEGRGEPYEGRVAIAMATINRTRYDIYPNTICKVVYQPGQFTWTAHDHLLKNPLSWFQSMRLARKVLANNRLDNIDDNTNGAVSFHLVIVNPDWSPMVKTVTIGHHIFYREPVAQ